MSEQRKKEVGKFMLSGLVATVLDYSLLNLFVGWLHVPLLLANSMSAPISSYVSYKLNKNVVFEDRMHGRRKTVLLYVGILAFGILVIQNAILHFVNGSFAETVAHVLQPALGLIALDGLSEHTVAINFAKLFASLFSAAWNYYMLRKFVFVTSDEASDA